VRGSSELDASGRHLRFAAFPFGSPLLVHLMSERARILPFNSSAFVGRAPLMAVPQTGDRLLPVLASVVAGLKIGFLSLNDSRHRHSCTIADSLADTPAYVCLRVPAPRAPRSSSRRPFHNAPPVPHLHTHACTSSSCPATSPGARPLHAPPLHAKLPFTYFEITFIQLHFAKTTLDFSIITKIPFLLVVLNFQKFHINIHKLYT
jgi:hypothetical protein